MQNTTTTNNNKTNKSHWILKCVRVSLSCAHSNSYLRCVNKIRINLVSDLLRSACFSFILRISVWCCRYQQLTIGAPWFGQFSRFAFVVLPSLFVLANSTNHIQSILLCWHACSARQNCGRNNRNKLCSITQCTMYWERESGNLNK